MFFEGASEKISKQTNILIIDFYVIFDVIRAKRDFWKSLCVWRKCFVAFKINKRSFLITDFQ